MKAVIGCLIGLVFSVGVSAESVLEGRVRLASGEAVAQAQVQMFDMTDLQRGAVAQAMTDGRGYFALPLAGLPGLVLPKRFELGANYPNPFNPSTLIPYHLAASSYVRLEVFNLLGQRIATLVEGEQPAGVHTAVWDATDGSGQAVGAGVYLYRLTVGGAHQTGRMVLVDGQAGVLAVGSASVLPGASGGSGAAGEGVPVYGLVVSGSGIAPYVVADLGIQAGMAPVELVVEAHPAGKILGDDGSLFDLSDLFNTSAEEAPDLVVVSVSVSDTTLTTGQAFTLNAKVRNQGDEPSAATTLRYYRSTDATITSDDEAVGTDAIVALNPSAISGVLISLTAPTSAGTYYYGACVESVADESESDNNCSRAVTVTVSGTSAVEADAVEAETAEAAEADSTSIQGGPDLIVASASVSDTKLTPGQAFTLNVTVQNQGDEPSVATTLRYYSSNNATITSGDEEEGTDAIGALNASATSTESIALTAPTDGRETYFYGACVESVRGESNTDNNCSQAVKITVSGQVATEEEEEETPEEETPEEERADGQVSIPDANLRAAIAGELGLPEGSSLTAKDLASLIRLHTGFDSRGTRIRRLDGLEHCTALEYLSLYNNDFSDVGPLAKLTNLTRLDLNSNQISDVGPLANLTNLTRLELNSNQISDVGPLANLTNLGILHLSDNKISDVGPLAKLTRLEFLFLHDNQISDVGPLVNLTNLTELTLLGNPLSEQSLNKQIPALQAEGVGVTYGRHHVPEPSTREDPEDVFNIELRFLGEFPPHLAEIFQEAARIWEGVVVGDIPSTPTERFRFEWTQWTPNGVRSRHWDFEHPGGTIDDLLIYVLFEDWDDIVAFASIWHINEESNLPAMGNVTLNDRFKGQFSRSSLLNLALHEIGHVIGFTGFLMEEHGLRHSYQKSNLPWESWYFTGFNAMHIFVHALGGDTSVLLDVGENKDVGIEMGDWTHWPEYYHDTMGPSGQGSLITVLTAAAFEDMGYTVNYSNALPFYPSTRRLAPKISVDVESFFCGGVKDLSDIPRE